MQIVLPDPLPSLSVHNNKKSFWQRKNNLNDNITYNTLKGYSFHNMNPFVDNKYRTSL